MLWQEQDLDPLLASNETMGLETMLVILKEMGFYDSAPTFENAEWNTLD